jgi:chitodextrinase
MQTRRAAVARITTKTVLALCLFLAATSGTFVASSTNASAAPHQFLKNYQLYDRSQDIRSLQKFLNTDGFVIAQSGPGSPGNETSIFGLHTLQALKKFQSAHGLPTTGYFGPLTRADINSGGATANSSQKTSSTISGTTATTTASTTTPSSTPLPGYQPGQIIFIGGGSTNNGGGGGGGGGGGSNSTPDTTPPSTPTNLTAITNSSSQITLSWTASTDNVGVTGYKIYRNGTQLGTASTNNYNDTGLNPSTLYTYWVSAYDAAGNVSTTSTAVSAVTSAGPDQFGTTWKPVRVGAGGFISDIDIASDGTKVIHTDTYGAYVWTGSQWSQIVSMNTMPSGDPGAGLQQNAGVYEIRIAPSNTSRFYMYFNGYVYRSDNKGATWNATGFSHVAASGNDQITETMGPYIAIDPNNSNIVYVGTPSAGLFKSTNAGATFSSVSAVGVGSTVPANAGQGGSNIIAYDPSSSVVGGVTQGVYVSTYGVGVFHSTDGGSTWTELNSSGMPTTHLHIMVVSDGTLYVTDNSAGGAFKKYSGGAWSAISTGLRGVHSLAIDPTNLSRMIAIEDFGQSVYSTNGGSTWTWQTLNKVATDIPWLANTASPYLMAPSNIVFDPSQSNVLFASDGVGVWRSNPAAGSGITWLSQSAGIEQLVSLWAVSPPGGNPIMTFMDRPVFTITNPDVYPTQHGLNYNNVIIHGYSADWASANPSTIVVHAQNGWNVTSGYSTNGGGSDGGPANWTVFPGLSNITDMQSYGGTGNGTGASIAAASATNFALALSDSYAGGPTGLWVTSNSGVTWTKPTIPGVPTTGDSGWGGEYYFDRQIIAADRVNIGTFYAYNQGSGTATAGIYKSTDGGSTWSRVHTGAFDVSNQSFFNAQMRTVPGEAGNIFFTSGPATGDPVGKAFHRSTDGGATWTSVNNVTDVWSFGFGKAQPGGGGYPAIYIYGWVNGVGGVWRSDDNAATWTQLGGLYPLGSFDQVKVVEGDMNAYGRVYLGFAGSGFEYGDASDAQIPPTISSISAGTPGGTGATITWTTDQSSNSKVVYGTTANYGSASSNASLVTSHSITLTGLTSGTTYHYAVVSTDAQGYTATSTDQTFLTLDTTPPSIPTGLTATANSSTEIDLSWTASTDNVGVTGYKIYRNGTQVGTTTSVTAYADTGLVTSTIYNYTVAAYDAAGNVSSQSSSASATTQAGVTFTPTDDPAIQYLGYGGPTVTFSNVNIGTPSSDRVVVIGVVNNNVNGDSGTIGVTIGGITATEAAFSDTSTTSSASLWYASAPTGTSATVVVTAGGGGIAEMGILAGAINGASSVAPSATSTHPTVFDAGDPQLIPTSGTITVPANGVAVIFGEDNYYGSGSPIWTNTTSVNGDYFLATTTGNGAAEMMAHSYATGAQSYSVSSSVNNGFAFGGFGGVVAVWKP